MSGRFVESLWVGVLYGVGVGIIGVVGGSLVFGGWFWGECVLITGRVGVVVRGV